MLYKTHSASTYALPTQLLKSLPLASVAAVLAASSAQGPSGLEDVLRQLLAAVCTCCGSIFD